MCRSYSQILRQRVDDNHVFYRKFLMNNLPNMQHKLELTSLLTAWVN